MKKIILGLLLFFSSGILLAQKKKVSTNFYPVVIKFESLCCGVPSEQPLKAAITEFKKQYKIKTISARKIAPMGREGEYHLAFTLREMNREQRYFFKNKLNKIVPKLNDKGKAELVFNMSIKKESLPANVTIKPVVY